MLARKISSPIVLIPSWSLPAFAVSLPFGNPRIEIEAGGLALAGQFLEPATGALFDGVAILLEIGAVRWSGSDVGEGVSGFIVRDSGSNQAVIF